MNIFEIILLSFGLSMDAFAVAVCIGLSLSKFNIKKALIVGLYFGTFQAGMPVLGYLLGGVFSGLVDVDAYSHIIAFILLGFLGGKMIYGALNPCEGEDIGGQALCIRVMLTMALATSIDAMAVGVSFSFLSVHLWLAVGVIGVITLGMSMLGVRIGHIFGVRFKTKAEIAGGIILILIGMHMLFSA